MPFAPTPVCTPYSTLAFCLPRGSVWIVIDFVALLPFSERLPGAARGIGGAIREFKRGMYWESDRSAPAPPRHSATSAA